MQKLTSDTMMFNKFDKTKIQAKQSNVCLSFLVINILLPLKGAKWGVFNNRKLNEDTVSKLVEGLKADLENCTNKMVIEAAMQKCWLKDGMMDKFHGSVKGLRIQDVHKLELNKQSCEVLVCLHIIQLCIRTCHFSITRNIEIS